jgi:hypothetical protein
MTIYKLFTQNKGTKMKIFCTALLLLTVALSSKSEAQWNGYVYRPYNYHSLYPIYRPYNYNYGYRGHTVPVYPRYNYNVPVYPRYNYVSPRGDGRGYSYQLPSYPRFGR